MLSAVIWECSIKRGFGIPGRTHAPKLTVLRRNNFTQHGYAYVEKVADMGLK